MDLFLLFLLVLTNSTLFLFFFFLIFIFIYLWLCWVLVSVRGLSLVVASGDHSSSRCTGLTIAASLVAEHRLQMHRLSNCGSRAQLLHGTWDPPRPGLEPVSPALAGRLSTTAPPGKPSTLFLFMLGYFGLCTVHCSWKIVSKSFLRPRINLFCILIEKIYICFGQLPISSTKQVTWKYIHSFKCSLITLQIHMRCSLWYIIFPSSARTHTHTHIHIQAVLSVKENLFVIPLWGSEALLLLVNS